MMEEIYRLDVDWKTKLLLAAIVYEEKSIGPFRCKAVHFAGITGLPERTVRALLLKPKAIGAIFTSTGSNGTSRYRSDLKPLPKQAPLRGDRAGLR